MIHSNFTKKTFNIKSFTEDSSLVIIHKVKFKGKITERRAHSLKVSTDRAE